MYTQERYTPMRNTDYIDDENKETLLFIIGNIKFSVTAQKVIYHFCAKFVLLYAGALNHSYSY